MNSITSAGTRINQNTDIYGDVTSTGVGTFSSIVKIGGTASQFLKADGSVDSSTYITPNSVHTLTNKTISGSNNTLLNIGNSSLVNSSLTFGTTTVALGGTSSVLNGLTTLGATTVNATTVNATTFNGSVSGNASSATILQNTRNFYISGDVGSNVVGFNGSGDVNLVSTITSSVVTSKLLTGFVVGANTTIAATDSILGAFGKTQGQLNNKANSNATFTLGSTTITLGTTTTDVVGMTSLAIASGAVTGNNAALTVAYTGQGTQYGITLKPSAATTGQTTTAISFVSSSSNAQIASISHLLNNTGILLSGSFSGITRDSSDSSNLLATNSYVKSLFGAAGTSGTLDWNDISNTRPGVNSTLLMGNATNGPGSGSYFYSFVFEFTTKDGTGNMTQMAISYNNSREIYMRNRFSGSWTAWTRYLTSDNFNTYSPTLSGTGATGTWPISISGNAATATSSTSSSNATTANALTTARSIALSGDATGSANFDGSANITIPVVVADNSHAHTIANVTGLQAALDGKPSTTGTGATGTWAINITGSAASATTASTATTANALTTARNIALSGDATGSANFDGSANISIPITIGSTTVTGKVLTGYAAGANTAITATDTILGAFGKIQTQLDNKLSASSGTITIGTTPISLGGSSTTLAGLTSVTSDAAVVTDLNVVALTETFVDLGTSGSINLDTGNFFRKTITANQTIGITFPPAAGKVGSFIFEIINGGSFAVSWPTNTRWAGGSAPALTASGTDLIGMYTVDGGANWRAMMLSKDNK